MSDFQHIVEAWNVGELRQALQGLPDDTPVKVNVAETPGGDLVDEQVVVGAGFGQYRMGAEPEGVWHADSTFGIDCEFPTGSYWRADDDTDGPG